MAQHILKWGNMCSLDMSKLARASCPGAPGETRTVPPMCRHSCALQLIYFVAEHNHIYHRVGASLLRVVRAGGWRTHAISTSPLRCCSLPPHPLLIGPLGSRMDDPAMDLLEMLFMHAGKGSNRSSELLDFTVEECISWRQDPRG